MPEYAWNALRIASRQYLKRSVDLRLEGEGNLPRNGPAIIAARHYHHLIDGAAMMATVPHPLHILVGLDWIRNPVLRVTMHRLCNAAGWPIVYRRGENSPIDEITARRALRQAAAPRGESGKPQLDQVAQATVGDRILKPLD